MMKVVCLLSLLIFNHFTPQVKKSTIVHTGTTGYYVSNAPQVAAQKTDTVIPRENAQTLSSPNQLLLFAQSFIGTPYHFGASSPFKGFDCSGFVSYVFKYFNFNVPRSSIEFLNVGTRVKLADALPGDIILFTGTHRSRKRTVGHMGIILSSQNEGLQFIHSTSGKEHGVTITKMNETYQKRFIQIIRLFNTFTGVASN